MELPILYKFEIAPGVFIIETSRAFSFIPGQVVEISIGQIPPRIYSIANGTNEKVLRILFDVKPEGLLTNRLSQLKIGDIITVSEPFGNFNCTSEPAFWIANGTGIAPFYSMLLSGVGANKTLIHGSKYLNSFFFEETFEFILHNNYIRCCSRETDKKTFNGRITHYLSEIKHLPANQKYYLCGSSEMVVETRDILLAKGVPFNQILAEIYF